MAKTPTQWHSDAYVSLLKASAMCQMCRAYFELKEDERPRNECVVLAMERVAGLLREAMPPGDHEGQAALAMRNALGQAELFNASCIRASDAHDGVACLQFIDEISANAIWALNDDIDAAKDLIAEAA